MSQDETVGTLAMKLTRHLDDCMGQNRRVDEKLGDLMDGQKDHARRFDDISKDNRANFRILLAAVLSAAAAMIVATYQTHQDTVSKVQQAATVVAERAK